MKKPPPDPPLVMTREELMAFQKARRGEGENGMKKPWEGNLPILLIPESMASNELMDRFADSQPGDIIVVPDDFRYIEINFDKLTVKERGFAFELTHEGLKRLK